MSTTAASSSNNVLSDKVNRALHVRTDTPAMRAALDALANLPSEDRDSAGNGSGSAGGGAVGPGSGASGGNGAIIDARSVRAAIERDALRRALQFQSELKRLADDATMLRERVDAVARVAEMVGSEVESPVVVSKMSLGMGFEDGANGNGRSNVNDPMGSAGGGFHSAETPSAAPLSDEAAWEEERILAALLHSAYKSLLDASERQIAVDEFLDKFDLGDGEARLLDHYNFEGFVDVDRNLEGVGNVNFSQKSQGDDHSQSPWSHPNAALKIVGQPSISAMDDANAFFNALERLVIIRAELGKTFGGGNGSSRREDFYYETPIGASNDGNMNVSSQLGTNSALRMMEQLASRQERAHERIYQFLQFFLNIGHAAASTMQKHNVVPTSSADMNAGHSGRPPLSADVALHGALGRFRDGDEMDEAFGHPIIRRSLYVLRHSPAHRSHALELIASSRRTEVTRRFLLALTSGYDGAAPMEMRAHDPVAYVGDMLAFAFRAFRVEGELVKTLLTWKDHEGGNTDDNEETLFTNDGNGGKSSKVEKNKTDLESNEDETLLEGDEDDQGNKSMTLLEILAQSMGGVARPLRSRVSQVISSLASQGDGQNLDRSGNVANRSRILEGSSGTDEDETDSTLNRLVAVFSVCGLLRFYSSAIRKVLQKLQPDDDESMSYSSDTSKNQFLVTCDECLNEAAASYVASLRAYGAMLGSHSGPSETEAQLAQRVIVRISEERVASPGFADDASFAISFPDGDQLSLSFLVGTMIDASMPYFRTLDDSASLKSALTIASKSGLEPREMTKWSEVVEEKEKVLVEALVDSETDKVLDLCGLSGVFNAVKHMDGIYVEGMTMASYPGLTQKDVEAAMKQFYSSLFSPPIPTFEGAIKDPDLRKAARTKTAKRVVDVYREIYASIKSTKGGYNDFSFLGHDPDQVKTLLSL